MQKFHEWFDELNNNHLMAFQHYLQNDCFPEWFVVPNNVEFNENWIDFLMEKLAKEYLNLMIGPMKWE